MVENKELTALMLPIVRETEGRYRYLADLTAFVAKKTGHDAGNQEFGYSVYRANKIAEEEALLKRTAAMGFQPVTPELLQSLSGRKVDVLRGAGSLFGESVVSGKVVPDGRGGYLFLPGRNRTKGFYPVFIREAKP